MFLPISYLIPLRSYITTEQTPLREENPSIMSKICDCVRSLLPTLPNAPQVENSQREGRQNFHTFSGCGIEIDEYARLWAYAHQFQERSESPRYTCARRVASSRSLPDLTSGG